MAGNPDLFFSRELNDPARLQIVAAPRPRFTDLSVNLLPQRLWPIKADHSIRDEAALSRPILTARHVREDMFQRWDDVEIGVSAWDLLR